MLLSSHQGPRDRERDEGDEWSGREGKKETTSNGACEMDDCVIIERGCFLFFKYGHLKDEPRKQQRILFFKTQIKLPYTIMVKLYKKVHIT